jgi:uncharacterized BrkB/YihY/UPF0761 family membrane protein
MNLNIPRKLAKVGGVLISISGVVNVILGLRIGATFYDAYPGGKMGHVGVVAGVAAVVIGFIILFLIIPIYKKKNRLLVMFGGVLTIVFGHIGGIAGAIYVGTAGVAFCYTAGVWVIVAVVMGLRRREA